MLYFYFTYLYPKSIVCADSFLLQLKVLSCLQALPFAPYLYALSHHYNLRSWQSAAFECVSQKGSLILSPPEIYAEIAHIGKDAALAILDHVMP